MSGRGSSPSHGLVDVPVWQGQSVAEAIRSIAVTCYPWRQEFGGLKSDPLKRLKIR